MPHNLDHKTLRRWRSDPAGFISQVLHDPETSKPFQLLEAERQFLVHAFAVGDDGRLLYPEQVFSAPKKSGKTGFAALHLLTTVLLFGGRFGEGFACANDLEQATSRVFEACRRIVEESPLLRREAKITAREISFPGIGGSIVALASDYASAAGPAPTISTFDELWGYVSERSRRMWDEMIPTPTRKISLRLVVTHAGFEGESILLQELCKRGLAQPSVGTDLYAGDGLLMFWSHVPIAPWQSDRWLAEMRRSLRPNQYLRMIENRWVGSESSFIDMQQWDACVDPNARPVLMDRTLPVWIGIDASVKHDSTALVAVGFDVKAQQVRLINHRIFTPSPDRPIDFERQVEQTVLDWHGRYRVRSVRFDPYQMVPVSQRLTREGAPMQEFPQTSGNLTEMSSNLYELVTGRNIVVYPNEEIRLAVARAVAVEGTRGWKIAKDKAAHKIDVVVALAMASHAAVLAHKQKPQRIRVYVGSPAGYPGAPAVEIDLATGRPIKPERTRIRVVRLTEQERPAVRGLAHGRFGS